MVSAPGLAFPPFLLHSVPPSIAGLSLDHLDELAFLIAPDSEEDGYERFVQEERHTPPWEADPFEMACLPYPFAFAVVAARHSSPTPSIRGAVSSNRSAAFVEAAHTSSLAHHQTREVGGGPCCEGLQILGVVSGGAVAVPAVLVDGVVSVDQDARVMC